MTTQPIPQRRSLRLRSRLVLLAIVPPLLVAICIGGYMTHARLLDARQGLQERGEVIATNLAMAAELALLTRNLPRLEQLCQSTLQQPHVVSVALRDADGTMLVQDGEQVLNPDAPNLYRAAIGTIGVQVSDFETQHTAPLAQPLGFAEVGLSVDATLAREHRILLTSLALVGIGMLASLFAALRIGAGIARPMFALSHAMTRYRRGDHRVRLEPSSADEIGELTRDFNRMAQALEGSQNDLREQVRTATSELQRSIETLRTKNAELEAARMAALQAGQEKQDFLARMSHEIRTPLNAIVGFTRLLLEQPDQSCSSEYGRTIDRATQQLLHIVDGILNFTKLESGHVELEHRPFDGARCLQDAVALLLPAAREKGLELTLDLSPKLPQALVGDAHRLTQVLTNLLDNAVKFTARGQIRIWADYDHDAASGGRLSVTVEDTGIGLTALARERLFQPFAQGDGSVTRHFGGTGLGLAICDRLVRLMGGAMDVQSRHGHGSRFSFSVPCPIAESAHPSAPAAIHAERSQHRDGDRKPRRGQRVLVVEDNAFSRQLLRHMLDQRGLEVHEACDGVEAIDAVRKARFGLILMDIHMPGLDGIETARRISTRNRRGDAACPAIVALSADVFARDHHSAEAWPFDAMVIKPISDRALDQILAVYLGTNATAAARQPHRAAVGAAAAGHGPITRRQIAGEIDRLLCQLAAAVAAAQRQQIRDTAHELKGLCGFFGYRALEAETRALEAAVDEASPAQLHRQLEACLAVQRLTVTTQTAHPSPSAGLPGA